MLTPQHPMTPEQFDSVLTALAWRPTDFSQRAGLTAATVWRWRRGQSPIPAWVPEYLGALLEIQRLHARFVVIQRPAKSSA
jgi:hypothetical protein